MSHCGLIYVLKKKSYFPFFSSDDFLSDFNEWRTQEGTKSNAVSFWDSFIHIDFMNYFGFYIAIRTSKWELRNACLKQLTYLFHSFNN